MAQHSVLADRVGVDSLRGAEGLFSRLRAVKDAEEIALIRRAAAITCQAFEHIVERIVPEASERALARELAFVLSECGAESESFPAIIAAGARSALPHAKPSDAAVTAGEMVFSISARSLAGMRPTSRERSSADSPRTAFVKCIR